MVTDAFTESMSKLNWLRERQKSIGGSDAPVIAGVSRFKNVAQLYDDKTEPITDAGEETPDMRRGRMMEGLARELYNAESEFGILPANQNLFIRAPFFAHSLPDAWLRGLGEIVPVEIKVPRPGTWQKMYLHGTPPDWNVQCQHHMMVHNARRCLLVVMCPVTVTLLVETIERDCDLIESLLEREEAFWKCVTNRRRPPETVGDVPIEVPESTGVIVRITDAASERAAHAYLEAKSLVEDAGEILDAAKAKLIDAACGSDAFEVPGLLRCYHREQAGRKGFNKELAMRDFPALKDDKYVKVGKPSRPFRAYPLTK